MAVAHINGHNGHHKHNERSKIIVDQLTLQLEEPDPAPRDEPKPCSVRLGYGSWCFRPDGHEGEHEGAPPVYGPIEERPALWRKGTKGMVK